jgi:hypothetical protein
MSGGRTGHGSPDKLADCYGSKLGRNPKLPGRKDSVLGRNRRWASSKDSVLGLNRTGPGWNRPDLDGSAQTQDGMIPPWVCAVLTWVGTIPTRPESLRPGTESLQLRVYWGNSVDLRQLDRAKPARQLPAQPACSSTRARPSVNDAQSGAATNAAATATTLLPNKLAPRDDDAGRQAPDHDQQWHCIGEGEEVCHSSNSQVVLHKARPRFGKPESSPSDARGLRPAEFAATTKLRRADRSWQICRVPSRVWAVFHVAARAPVYLLHTKLSARCRSAFYG